MKTELGRQLSIAIENEPGRLGQVARLLANGSIRIEAFCVINNVEQGMVRLMTSDPIAAKSILKSAGLAVIEAEVLILEVKNGVGNLAAIGETLAASGINIEYAYASTADVGQPARLILRTTNPEKAKEVLTALGR